MKNKCLICGCEYYPWEMADGNDICLVCYVLDKKGEVGMSGKDRD